MNKHEAQLYVDAGKLAREAMGKVYPGRFPGVLSAADQDPLTWWCLTEWVVNIAHNYKEGKSR